LNSTEPDLELNRPLPAKYGQMRTSNNFSVTTIFLLVNCCTFLVFITVTVIFIFQLKFQLQLTEGTLFTWRVSLDLHAEVVVCMHRLLQFCWF